MREDLKDFFAPRDIIAGEDPGEYRQIVARLLAFVQPLNIIEEIYVEDLAGCLWDQRRYRRMRAEFLNSSAAHGLRSLLDSISDHRLWDHNWEDSDRWRNKNDAARFLSKDPETVEEVTRRLVDAGLSEESIPAQTFFRFLNEMAILDRMIAESQQRQTRILREIEYCRATLAKSLRLAASEILRVEFGKGSEAA